MFVFSAYSAFTVWLFSSIFILLIVYLTEHTMVLSKIPGWVIMLILSLLCLRMIFPFEFLVVSKGINSFTIMPKIKEAVSSSIIKELSVFDVFKIIWFFGFYIALIKYIAEYFIFKKRFNSIFKFSSFNSERANNILEKIKTKYNFKFNVKVVSNFAIDSPAEFGLIDKFILIDDSKYSDNELYYILLHELVHIHNGTNWIKALVSLFKCVFWWNPVVYIMGKYVNDILEIYVDRFVIGKGNSKVEYMNCIVRVLEKSNISVNRWKFVQPMAVSSEGELILKRMLLIKSNKKASKFLSGFLLVLLMVFMTFSFRYVIQSAYEPPKGELFEDVKELNDENSYIVKEGDLYVLYINGELFTSSKDLKDLPSAEIIEK